MDQTTLSNNHEFNEICKALRAISTKDKQIVKHTLDVIAHTAALYIEYGAVYFGDDADKKATAKKAAEDIRNGLREAVPHYKDAGKAQLNKLCADARDLCKVFPKAKTYADFLDAIEGTESKNAHQLRQALRNAKLAIDEQFAASAGMKSPTGGEARWKLTGEEQKAFDKVKERRASKAKVPNLIKNFLNLTEKEQVTFMMGVVKEGYSAMEQALSSFEAMPSDSE